MRPSVCVQRRFQAHGASLFFSCRLLCLQTRFVLKLFFYKFAELVQTLDIFIIELSVGHRGNIEIECGVRADGVEICVKESFERMSLLGVPIEPARADGHISFSFCRLPGRFKFIGSGRDCQYGFYLLFKSLISCRIF